MVTFRGGGRVEPAMQTGLRIRNGVQHYEYPVLRMFSARVGQVNLIAFDDLAHLRALADEMHAFADELEARDDG